MYAKNATPLQEQAIRAAIDYEPRFPGGSAISSRSEEPSAMTKLRRGVLLGLAVMVCAYFLGDWLGDWAFWIDVVGEVCVISAFVSGLKYL